MSFPERGSDVTAEWITEVLVADGYDVEVAAVSSEPVGTGQMATSERLTLTYAAGSAEAPATLVGKFASDDPTSRAAGAAGGYAKEIFYYRIVDPTVSIRVPRCHRAELSEDGSTFVLILEDMAPATQGDQIAGCGPEEARVALVNLAGLHGPRWNDRGLFDLELFDEPSEEGVAFLAELMVADTAGFIERYRDRLGPDDPPVLERFAARVGPWILDRPRPFAPVHGDYRLDNLLFGAHGGTDPVAAVDWQTLTVGLPLSDVAYFCGNGLVPEVRRAVEADLVDEYHRALVDLGVDDYPASSCWEDYCYGSFFGLTTTILGAMHVVRTDRGDDMFMAMVTRHCEAIRDLDALDLLG